MAERYIMNHAPLAEWTFASIICTMYRNLAAVILSFTIAGASWAQVVAQGEQSEPTVADTPVTPDDGGEPGETPVDPSDDQQDEPSTTAATGPVVMVEPVHRSGLASCMRSVLVGFARRLSLRPTAPLSLSHDQRDISNGRCVATSLAMTAMPVRPHAPPATS